MSLPAKRQGRPRRGRQLPGGLVLRLFTLVILPFSLVLFGLAVSAVSIHERAMRSLVAQRDERAVAAGATALSEEVRHLRIAVRGLALRLDDGVSPARVVREAGPSSGDFPQGLAVVALDGRVEAGSLPPAVRDAGALARILSRARAERGAPLPPVSVSADTAVVAAATNRGASAAVGAFAIAALLGFALPDAASHSENASAVILDPETGLIARLGAPLPEIDYRNHPGVRLALQGATGSSFVNSPGGEEHVLAYGPISSTPWVLLIEEPWQSVVSPLLRLSLLAPLALAPALAISLVGLWFAAQWVVRPLRRLQRLSLKLAAGEFEVIHERVGGIEEIADLQRSMAIMASGIQSAQQAMRQYIGKVTTAQEEERKRLAQDLHDETTQDLIALDQRIQLLLRSLPRRNSARVAQWTEVHRRAQEAIQNLRRLSRALRPASLEELGLPSALEALASDMASSTGISISAQTRGSPQRLSPEIELSLYRIVQEALSNIARHAEARHARVVLRSRGGSLRVIVEDDGRGFTPPAEAAELSRAGHFGMIGMRERSQLIGARIEWRSSPGRGTQVRLELPLPHPEESTAPA